MGRKYEIISADGHIEVPPERWTHYLPAKYQDRKPHTVKLDDGREAVHLGDHEYTIGMVIRADIDDDIFIRQNGDHFHNPDGSNRPGTGKAAQRLQEQDRDGIDAEILNAPGSGPRFALNVLKDGDKEFYSALIEAYNTWLAEEYCATAPDRLIGIAAQNEIGLEDGILEMERCKKMGLNLAGLSSWPNGSPYYQTGDEKFFAAMTDLDMLISPHSNFGASAPRAGAGSGDLETVLYHRAAGPCYAVSQLIVQGIFDKVPNGKIYFGETYVSWFPITFNRMDEHYMRRRAFYDFNLRKLPSEYIRDHMSFSFIHERQAMPLRHYIGLDNVMWGSDFPHNVNTFPHSLASLDEMMKDVPEAEKRAVLVDTPCKWFQLDANADITPTPTSIE
jgi:predicted TIM-barrel fold metal-dependent hydrolase